MKRKAFERIGHLYPKVSVNTKFTSGGGIAPSELTVRVDVLYRRVMMNSMNSEGVKILESGPFLISFAR